MKRIVSFALMLALVISTLAVLPVFATDTALIGTDVTLTEGISLNFYIDADGAEGVTNATPVVKNGKECYKLTVNLGARQMGDELAAVLKNGNAAIGETYTSSVRSYADALIASTLDKATRELVYAMLGYGAAAQNYFEYKTDALVGTPVTDTAALIGAVAPEAQINDPADIYVGASLVLEGDLILRFYFEGNGLNLTLGGEALTATDADGYCYADVAVTPDTMGEQVEIVCGDTTVRYGVINYLKNKADDPALAEMVASIYAYGIAAEDYVRVSSCDHEGMEVGYIQMPTIYNGGIRGGECELCGGYITEATKRTEADVKKYNPISSSSDSNLRASFSNQINIVDNILAGGKHFYPAEENGYEGRDLYVEFSFLYNETLDNNSKGYIDIFRIEEENGQSAHTSKLGNYQGHSFYFLNLRDNVSGQWCPYEGGFETGDIDSAAGGIVNGPSMPNHASVSGETKDDYVFIGDYGWHRMGLRVHQEARIESGKVVYTVETSFYIDGVLVSRYFTNLIASKYNDLLFTAEISDGKLVYSDIAENKNVLFYKIRETYSTSTYYLATADEYATAGDGFMLDVEPIASPEYEKFTADGGVELDGTRHFKLKDEIEVAEPERDGDKVILISVDGLRPDAISNTEFIDTLKEMGSYTLNAQTIYPSKTMPAHMSMFHSVTPNIHGMNTNNVYAPSGKLGNGITETLTSQGYTAAMFFDWENMQYLTKVENNVERNYVQWYKASGERYHERSTVELTNALIEHIENDPTDFTYLYFGMTDQMGHDHNWLSNEYYIAIDHIFSNIMRILEAVSDEYTVIITTDHGGGGGLGANEHGSSAAVDMTTPIFIIGDGFEAGGDLGEASILDIAPTVASILGADAEDYWLGTALATDGELIRMNKALDLILSNKAWSDYKYGGITSTAATEDSITIQLYGHTGSSSKGICGMQLTRYAISEMISLGFRYLSFTATLEAISSGKTPTYVDIYTYVDASESSFAVSTCDSKDPDNYEFYYASGREIVLDLLGLYACLTDSYGYGLILVLSDGLYWNATNGGCITIGDIELSRALD